jgi:hypothetical protein
VKWCLNVGIYAGLEVCRVDCLRLRLMVYKYFAASQGLQVPTGFSRPDVFKESGAFVFNRLGLRKKESAESGEEIRTCNVTRSRFALKEAGGRLRDSLFNHTFIILKVLFICCQSYFYHTRSTVYLLPIILLSY